MARRRFRIDRVSLVDDPANPQARVVLWDREAAPPPPSSSESPGPRPQDDDTLPRAAAFRAWVTRAEAELARRGWHQEVWHLVLPLPVTALMVPERSTRVLRFDWKPLMGDPKLVDLYRSLRDDKPAWAWAVIAALATVGLRTRDLSEREQYAHAIEAERERLDRLLTRRRSVEAGRRGGKASGEARKAPGRRFVRAVAELIQKLQERTWEADLKRHEQLEGLRPPRERRRVAAAPPPRPRVQARKVRSWLRATPESSQHALVARAAAAYGIGEWRWGEFNPILEYRLKGDARWRQLSYKSIQNEVRDSHRERDRSRLM